MLSSVPSPSHLGSGSVESLRVSELPGWQRAKRDAIVVAAAALLEERPVESIHIRDVAERAGVALGTLYRYFRSKEQVLAAVLEHWAAWDTAPPEIVGDSVGDRLRARARFIIDSVEESPHIFTVEQALRHHSDPVVAEAQRRWSAGGAAWVSQDLTALGAPLATSAAVAWTATLNHVLTEATNGAGTFDEARRVIADLAEILVSPME